MLFNPRLNPSGEVPCWSEDGWEDMTEEDWEEFYDDRYHEGCGGD